MINDINVDNILRIYETEISKNVRNKKRLYKFEVNKMQNIEDIIFMIKNGKIHLHKYNIFLIYEPKCRLVMSLTVKEKVVNHFLTRFILEKKLTKYLCDRNIATRKDMGVSYGVELVLKYINREKNKHKKLYALSLDISKYFYSIDHEVLKQMLKEQLDDFEYRLMEKAIDSTNWSYINETINWYIENRGVDLPYYNTGKGLPIGNMTSQFLSIYYLNKLDHFILHDLKCKNYVRYMDDFLIIDNDLEKLKRVRDIIIDKLKNEYKLNVNPKKTCINSLKSGFSFLGYTYRVVQGKTIVKIKKANLERLRKRIKNIKREYKKGKIREYKAFCSIMTYTYSYKYSKDKRLQSLIDKCWYGK